jgi:hypothetical protein
MICIWIFKIKLKWKNIGIKVSQNEKHNGGGLHYKINWHLFFQPFFAT